MSIFDRTLNIIRFGVGAKDKPYSSVWVAFTNNNDLYLGVRGLTGAIKVSLHESELCRLAVDEQYWTNLADHGVAVQRDRAIVKWRRSSTPETGVVHVLSLLFPTDFLRLYRKPLRLNKPVFYIEPAPEGHAIEFGFFYSKEGPETLEEKLLSIGTPMFNTCLLNGEFVSMISREIPFGPENMPPFPNRTSDVEPLSKDALPGPGENIQNLSAMLFDRPKDGGILSIVQVDGLTISRDA